MCLKTHLLILTNALMSETSVTPEPLSPVDDTTCDVEGPMPDEDDPDCRCSVSDRAHLNTFM